MLRLRITVDPRAAAGARRQDAVQRVRKRAHKLVSSHPAWAPDDLDPTHTLTVSDEWAALVSESPPRAPVVIRYPGVVPGTAALEFAKAFDPLLGAVAAQEVRDLAAIAHQLLRAIERLLHDLDLALLQNDLLRSQLREARVEIDFLRRQLDQVSESLKTNRRGITKAMLAAVAAILLAVVTGTAEAAGNQLLDNSDSPPNVAAAYLERCNDVLAQLDGVNGSSESVDHRE